MNFERIKEKLNILADAGKYDVSCSSADRLSENIETLAIFGLNLLVLNKKHN